MAEWMDREKEEASPRVWQVFSDGELTGSNVANMHHAEQTTMSDSYVSGGDDAETKTSM